MLCIVNNHWVDVVDGGLEFIVAQLTFSQAKWATLISSGRTSVIADRAMSYLPSTT